MINNQHNKNIRNIQRLLNWTPRSFYLLIGGSLPGIAILHQRQLTLFGMICRLADSNSLLCHAKYYFSTDLNYESWFQQIEELCSTYDLPSCQQLIDLKLEKVCYKKLIKLKIADHWQAKLREEAAQLSSLKYFKPQFYSLLSPSKAYETVGYNRYEIAKLNIQLKMLSGRYPTEKLARYWSQNKNGFCLLGPPCSNKSETISHILTECPVLESKRVILRKSWIERETVGPLSNIIKDVFTWDYEDQTAFLLDPLSNPIIIDLSQNFGSKIIDKISYLTRTYCFSIHRQRKIILGTWYNSGYPAPNRTEDH